MAKVDSQGSKEMTRIEMKSSATEIPSNPGDNGGFVKCVQCAVDL
jgi:hypothetical protein